MKYYYWENYEVLFLWLLDRTYLLNIDLEEKDAKTSLFTWDLNKIQSFIKNVLTSLSASCSTGNILYKTSASQELNYIPTSSPSAGDTATKIT